MKKVFATLTVLAMLTFGSVAVMAQEEAQAAPEATEQVQEQAVEAEAPAAVEAAPVETISAMPEEKSAE